MHDGRHRSWGMRWVADCALRATAAVSDAFGGGDRAWLGQCGAVVVMGEVEPADPVPVPHHDRPNPSGSIKACGSPPPARCRRFGRSGRRMARHVGRAAQFLLLVFAGWVNRRLREVVEYLQEENRVLREQLGDRRLRSTDAQRRRLAAKGRAIGRRALEQLGGLVTPDTIRHLGRGIAIRGLSLVSKRATAGSPRPCHRRWCGCARVVTASGGRRPGPTSPA